LLNQQKHSFMMTSLISLKNSALSFWGLCMFLSLAASSQPNYPRTPEQAKVVYTDLVHFVEAYNELATNSDTLQVLQTMYFDRGSEGLKEFIRRHQLSPEMLRDAMLANPERYALLPNFLANISVVEDTYLKLMQDYSSVLPNAMYPPTYLLVGANRGIGQASLVGQLITVTRAADNLEKLQKIMTHELSHFQQAMAMGGQKYAALYTAPNNMLGICLREGGAEFVTSLVLNDITQSAALDYIKKNESSLKQKFTEDLETQNKNFWLWASIGQNEYPRLLGYAMGYLISKKYYEQAPDKTAALQNILLIDDAEAFVQSSGYFGK